MPMYAIAYYTQTKTVYVRANNPSQAKNLVTNDDLAHAESNDVVDDDPLVEKIKD